LDVIIRGHEQVARGSLISHDDRVITIWSAPAKKGRTGAYLNIDSIEHVGTLPTLSTITDWSGCDVVVITVCIRKCRILHSQKKSVTVRLREFVTLIKIPSNNALS